LIFLEVSRLTVEDAEDRFERRKPDYGDFAGFDFGNIEIGDPNLFCTFATREIYSFSAGL